VKKNQPERKIRKAAKRRQNAKRKGLKAKGVAKARQLRRTAAGLSLTAAGRYALLDPEAEGWGDFRDPEAMRAMLLQIEADDAFSDRWLDELVRLGMMQKR
jgi:muramidase (phage lysozyme)